jgi:hypothetical protein
VAGQVQSTHVESIGGGRITKTVNPINRLIIFLVHPNEKMFDLCQKNECRKEMAIMVKNKIGGE